MGTDQEPSMYVTEECPDLDSFRGFRVKHHDPYATYNKLNNNMVNK